MKTYEDKKRARINTSMFILITISLFLLFLFSCSINVHAEDMSDVARGILANVDSTGESGGGAGSGGFINGMSQSRSGYLCYLLTKNGAPVPGSSARLFKSPGASYISNSLSRSNPRKGDYYKPTSWTAEAPWGCAPYYTVGKEYFTNEPAIKSWLAAPSTTPGHPNAQSFIDQYWGSDAAAKFATDDYILIIEIVMNFQWSAPKDSSVSDYMDFIESLNWVDGLTTSEIYTMVSGLTGLHEETQLKVNYLTNIINTIRTGNANGETYIACDDIVNSLKRDLKIEIAKSNIRIPREYSEGSTGSTSNSVLFGDPIIATVPEALKYKNEVILNETYREKAGNRYARYMNYHLPFGERILANDCGEQAGFLYFNGSKDDYGEGNYLTDDQVIQHGLAMLAVSASSLGLVGTHTWDSENHPHAEGPAPEAPTNSLPSERQYTIIKSYRLRTSSALDDNLGVELEDKGTYIREKTIRNIEIEDEPLNETDKNYKVIGWKISNTPKPINLDAINWEGEVPQPIRDSGTTTSNVALDKDHKFLYVLLEANEATTSTLNTNYIISEATITRCVRLSHPDSDSPSNSLKSILSYPHPWQL